MHKGLIICGQTASGKTSLGIYLARKFNGELVSADSRQIYKQMDIATGKDFQQRVVVKNLSVIISFAGKVYKLVPYDFDGIPMWMYDVVRPDEQFSVSHFRALATNVIISIHKRGKMAIIVGGSGLYIRALTESLPEISVPPDPQLRRFLSLKTLGELQQIIIGKQPQVWQKLNDSDRKNPRRLIRKIELAEKAAPPVHDRYKRPKYDILKIGLFAKKKFIEDRIDTRVEQRMRMGVLNEIRRLLANGYSWQLPSMSTLGYSQWREYFENDVVDMTQTEGCAKWKNAEHAYAKKQLVWFRKERDVVWIDIQRTDFKQITERIVQSWYTK